MIKVNSLSGGRTSSYLAMHYGADHNIFSVVCIDNKDATPKDPTILKYTQEKLSGFTEQFGEFIATAEDDATLKVMMDLEQLMGQSITWVRGVSFDGIINEKNFFGGKPTRLPSWARRYCTTNMKLLPIFLWWWQNIHEKCEMRIGFRFDEFGRMENFFNGDPNNFAIPTQCSTLGMKRQKHTNFNWRKCHFPLIRDGVRKEDVDAYWATKTIGGSLFEEQRHLSFPAISNCIGCFHKKPETLAAMSDIHPEKFRWFIDQEQKGMGTWLDNKVTYQHIMDNRFEIGKEVIFEARAGHATCDTGGCTD